MSTENKCPHPYGTEEHHLWWELKHAQTIADMNRAERARKVAFEFDASKTHGHTFDHREQRCTACKVWLRAYLWDVGQVRSGFNPSEPLHCEPARRAAEAELAKKKETLLDEMTAEQRVALFRMYCTSCGDKNPGCHCWRDE